MRQKNVEPITMWQALNEPVAEISEGVAAAVFTTAAVILLAVWMMPYWGNTVDITAYHSELEPKVAGAQIVSDALTTPEWYYVIEDIPADVTSAFSEAASEVLDISDPVSEVAEFYEPGADAVWDAWLELMADPY